MQNAEKIRAPLIEHGIHESITVRAATRQVN